MPNLDLEYIGKMANILYSLKRARGDEQGDALARQRLENAILEGEQKRLGIMKSRRELAGPSPEQKYMEKKRSDQVKSSLDRLQSLWRDAGPGSKGIYSEMIRNLYGAMTPFEKTESEMILKQTPINPRIQKAQWFEETNPRPGFPLVKEGDSIINPPRSSEYRKLWSQYDVEISEWEFKRNAVMEGKTSESEGTDYWKKMPRLYPTDNPNIFAYRDAIDKGIKELDLSKMGQAEVATALEKGWQTPGDIMRTGFVKTGPAKDFSVNNQGFSAQPARDLVSGRNAMDILPAGKVDESKITMPKELMSGLNAVNLGKSPKDIGDKNVTANWFYESLKKIDTTGEKEGLAMLRDLQAKIINQYPSPQRFIPLRIGGKQRETFLSYITPGFFDSYYMEGGGWMAIQADRVVPFRTEDGKSILLWYSDLKQIAYDNNGIPIPETSGLEPGSLIPGRR